MLGVACPPTPPSRSSRQWSRSVPDSHQRKPDHQSAPAQASHSAMLRDDEAPSRKRQFVLLPLLSKVCQALVEPLASCGFQDRV